MNIDKAIDLSRQKKVEDEFIGVLTLCKETHNWSFALREDYYTTFYFPKDSKNKKICVVLESPHISEFNNVNLHNLEGEKVQYQSFH